MARSAIDDMLQVYPFWIFDVAPIEPLALPVFTPLLGFSAITSPEMNIDMYEVSEANWLFRKKVAKKADVSPITLSRGSRWYDSDFYRWILATLTGQTGGVSTGLSNPSVDQALQLGGVTPRRDLLLVHFLSRSPFSPAVTAVAAAAGLLAAGASSPISGLAAAGLGIASIVTGSSIGPFEFAPRLPAKAWMLYGCLPSRYKAGGDFDAMSSEVSIMELELAVEMFDEISLASV